MTAHLLHELPEAMAAKARQLRADAERHRAYGGAWEWDRAQQRAAAWDEAAEMVRAVMKGQEQ